MNISIEISLLGHIAELTGAATLVMENFVRQSKENTAEGKRIMLRKNYKATLFVV